MKYIIWVFVLSSLIFSGCSSVSPAGKMVAYTASAHVEGEDVLFEHNGKYYKAKGQREIFEKKKGAYMTVISMSDGSYIIQHNEKQTQTSKGSSYVERKAQKEQEEKERKLKQQEEKERVQRLEEERIEHLRSKTTHEQNMEKARAKLKAEKQEAILEMRKKKLQAQLDQLKKTAKR
ncbi:hypothetical protein [Cytobacillus firmus]|uniref:hypothetical protein n=1 Tax=Cytobacillus firmus TaxID=1399 RepID=UPI0018CE1FCE|nr:hypothetical protein [Cytobacillus firmus]MBG9585533.1 hypothetical protein [Cytobacillus firmus]